MASSMISSSWGLLSRVRLWLKLYFCSLRRMVSLILPQNLMAGKVWSKNCGDGDAHATKRMLDFEVSVLLIDETRPMSPSSNCYRLPKADFKSWVDRELKLLVTNYRTEVSLICPTPATDYSEPHSSTKLIFDTSLRTLVCDCDMRVNWMMRWLLLRMSWSVSLIDKDFLSLKASWIRE